MTVNRINKFHLNLAGEYRVCSELLKRDIFATVTFGNMKGCDVVAIGCNRRSAIIEVKASQSSRFVTGFYQEYKTRDREHPTFWVLCSVRNGGAGFKESFFVLTHEEMAEAQAQRNRHGDIPYEERGHLVGKGVDNVLATDVEAHKDKWEKIVEWCSHSI